VENSLPVSRLKPMYPKVVSSVLSYTPYIPQTYQRILTHT
jgi:hypothetical protein